MIYSSRVTKGQQLGRTLGFPTINLDPQVLPIELKPGVYQAQVTFNGENYLGALFFGPKKTFDEIQTVLEIYLLNFDQEIYGESVEFSLGKFIRPVIKFASIDDLKTQMAKDVIEVFANDNVSAFKKV